MAAFVVERGQVTVAALAQHFGVSADTVRRDLDQLDADGVLIRTHGGALAPQALPRPDTTVDVRTRLRSDAKEIIGALAAGLVQDGQVVMMNAGTTVLSVVRHLEHHHDLILATNNLRIPAEVPPGVFHELYVFGGTVRLSAQDTTGPVSFPVAAGGEPMAVRADLAFVAVGGVSAGNGWSTSHLAEATMMREMAERARSVVVLADSSKFGRDLFARVGDLAVADVFVTDTAPTGDLARALADAGVRVVSPSG
nr:DeoR/GlpR family DNA-binding transcription regulator [Nakamurella flavida]